MHLHVVIHFANQFVQGKDHLNLQMNQEATKAFSSLKVTYGMAIATPLGHNITRCIKNSNLRKEVGIAIKSKETSSQFESVRNSYVAIMHQPITICSTM